MDFDEFRFVRYNKSLLKLFDINIDIDIFLLFSVPSLSNLNNM